MIFNRREVVKLGLAAIPLARLSSIAAFAQPSSKFKGVQIGIIISPVLFPDMPLGAKCTPPTYQWLGGHCDMGCHRATQAGW